MLKNIRLHIERDEDKQQALESKLASHIAENQKNSVNAFHRSIPSVLNYIDHARSENIAIFCNKQGKFNVVDYGVGRALYGFDPEAEIRSQFEAFSRHSHYIDFAQDQILAQDHASDGTLSALPSYRQYTALGGFPSQVNLLVVLGIGLGHHIKYLLESSTIKHMIIYEPELQYFNCSILVTPWREILELAKQKGTALYFQLEKDGRDLVNDIKELSEHFSVDGFHLYHHYHHPVFDSIQSEFSKQSWQQVLDKGISFKLNAKSDNYCPIWSPPAGYQHYSVCSSDSSIYAKNLASFEKYFPSIFTEFKDYQPSNWVPIQHSNGQINILNRENLVAWYSDEAKQDCLLNLQNYSEQPNKDGLVLGYNGEKLKNYLHFKFVKEAEPLLEELEEEEGVLPDTIKSMIMFGLGVGYQLEHLLDTKEVEKLFICEPNRDFFYASLFAIDWSKILEKMDQSNARLYINIGDDGTNLFRDLLNQFYAIGPYVLSHTYFYQSYYNSSLTQAVAQLREQLQVVIAMGEYFDHARYGIAHTTETLKCEYPYMVKGSSAKLSLVDKEVPVFLVGNGPSIDQSLDSIREWQGNAIIVSCGTALQVLQKNGIKPDFHAEIEQNRSTFDWAARINDFSFLKSITLISCNGIHPDTCELYKDVLLAFKEGESSTVSSLKVLGEDNFDTLAFAFPTVSNFALNFFIKLGFNQLYLLGIDLGFVDSNKHHSSESGYYKNDGKPMYDYSEKNNTSLVVPGNMRPTVFTKHEFKIAKVVIEQSLAAAKVDCYNTSDGAKIFGTLALPSQDILLTSEAEAKLSCLNRLRRQCFLSRPKETFLQQYTSEFSQSTLQKELSMFKQRLAQSIDTSEQAEMLIESQKRMLFASYQQGESLLFYMLYGTTNYANVLLNKVIYSFSGTDFNPAIFNKARKLWLKYFESIENILVNQSSGFDNSASFPVSRMISCIKSELVDKKILVVSDVAIIDDYTAAIVGMLGYKPNISTINAEQFFIRYSDIETQYDFIIFQLTTASDHYFTQINSQVVQHFSHAKILYICQSDKPPNLIKQRSENVHLYYSPADHSAENSPVGSGPFASLTRVILYALDMDNFDILIPKYVAAENYSLDGMICASDYQGMQIYDLGMAIGLKSQHETPLEFKLKNGNRASYLGDNMTNDLLYRKKLNVEELQKRKIKSQKTFPFLKVDS
jgi:hypothetical protein